MSPELVPNLVDALIYAVVGMVIFLLSFLILDKVTPASLWHEIIEEHNTALAIMIGGISIGIAIVIAAAIY